ncbi:MAG TPA: SPOR domain-containing protein [Gammaproteobacteria bacterium]|jgi:hypothetical protein|nr:SPOR domain-containing protein [Gammaproteobacteria bacterium]
MAKDYAKYTHKNKRGFLAKGWRFRLFIVIFLFILFSSFGAGIYVWQHHANQIVAFYTEIKYYLGSRPKNKVAFNHPTQTAAKPEVQFHFYTELPKMQVVVPTPNLQSDLPQKHQYVVQIAVFKNLKEASEMRISLLLAGFEVNLIKTETSFILQDGPYKNIADAKRMQIALKKKGYENTKVLPL